MKIYHNPRCSKCREALELIEGKGIKPEIVSYLEEVPTKEEIKEILGLLDLKAEALIRKNEPIFKEKYKGKKLTNSQWIVAMSKYPKLIERPIIINKGKAIIGRPPSLVLELM